MKKLTIGIGATALLSLGACAEGPANDVDNFGYNGTGIAVGISPLTLDSLSDACYSFAVVNGAKQAVVTRGPSAIAPNLPLVTGVPAATPAVCASQFGNTAGGDISYVAPCDADNTPDGNNLHEVHLWVDTLCVSGTGIACPQTMQDYENPCPSTNGCVLPVTCVENADTPVTFNLTIMGQADQGFFDIAVNFDDVFCSAKLDDCSTNADGSAGPKIKLLFDTNVGSATFGQRVNTIVAAVACTAGPGSSVRTTMNFSPLRLTCTTAGTLPGFPAGANTVDLSTVTQEGNLTGTGTYPAAIYFGTEALNNAGGTDSANKVYTNVAFGVGDASGCSISWQVAPFNSASATAPTGPGIFASYGYLNFNAKAGDVGGAQCHRHPLNQSSTVLETLYATSVNGTAVGAGLNASLTQDAAAFEELQLP